MHLGDRDFRSMLDRLDSVQSVRYHYKGESPTDQIHVGVLAQSMPEEVVSTNEEIGLMGVSYTDYLGYLTGAVRGLRAETKENEAALRWEIVALRAELKDLKRQLAAR